MISVDSEIIIVDNNSSDKSVSITKEIMHDCKIIENKTNIGFAAASNIGAENASGELLLFLNPDVKLDSDAIAELISAYETEKTVGAISARMRFDDTSFQATCRQFPGLSNLLFSRGSVISRLTGVQKTYTLPDYERNSEVPAVAGTALMIRKNLFMEIGKFDQRFFLYMEDTDLCLRLTTSGMKNYFCPKSGGVHFWAEGSDPGWIKREWHHHLSMTKYFFKNSNSLLIKAVIPVLLVINFFLLLILKPFMKKRNN